METIAVVGSGYVGLVAAACFSHVGHQVTCLDIDEKKIELLKQGKVPFYEPNLEPLVRQGIDQNLLHFTTSYPEALSKASFVILAVDTPMQEDGSCDTTNILRAASSLGEHTTHNLFVVIKSTVPVGTCELVEQKIQEYLTPKGLIVDVVSNPEFLKEGDAVHDFMQPDRIILGVKNEHSEQMMMRLYAPFNHLSHKFVVMDPPSSELTKYASNTMLALRISYMNWLSQVCEVTGADIDFVRSGLSLDHRIGSKFLRSGIGFGGSCFPKDIHALAFLARSHGLSSALIDDIDAVNEAQKKRFSEWILEYLRKRHPDTEPCTVALLGLSFKPGTDDMRKAPSLTIIRELLEAGIHIQAFDPIATFNAKAALTEDERAAITWCDTIMETAKEAQAVAILTEWPEIGRMDLKQLRSVMNGKGFFDGRSLFTEHQASLFDFDYFCLGKPSATPKSYREYAFIPQERKT